MNVVVLALAVLVGVASVIQAALNRRISAAWGLPAAIVLNALVLVTCATILYALSRAGATPSELFRPKPEAFSNPRWWYLLPGLLGLVIVAALPLAISKVGALQIFVTVVAGQMLAGLVWDKIVEGVAITPSRVAGVLLVIVGAAIASVRPS
ncbi:MAG: DMT family transporter [Myxococcales bacterium]|nr:DMT family transporter [Myxococcales bacterium]